MNNSPHIIDVNMDPASVRTNDIIEAKYPTLTRARDRGAFRLDRTSTSQHEGARCSRLVCNSCVLPFPKKPRWVDLQICFYLKTLARIIILVKIINKTIHGLDY